MTFVALCLLNIYWHFQIDAILTAQEQSISKLTTSKPNSNFTHELHSFLFQAKDLHLSLILICVICVFFICNFPRLLLNLYEMFHCDAIIACGDRFFPPVWFICSNAVNHLLLVVNCIMNFVVYCYFNRSFR